MTAGGRSRFAVGSRRQLTALCYDLVGSTRLALTFDPEDMRDLQRAFHETCTHAVRQFGGHIDSYAGDGAMALFGYPTAREDDAERAVRAGLEILSGCKRLNGGPWPAGTEIAVRVGVATGLVAAGEADTNKADVVGFALNLAFKLQSVADPDTVLVSDATRALTAGLFAYLPEPTGRMSGVAGEVQAWRALRSLRVLSRFRAVRAVRGGRLTPMVSRHKELRAIGQAWSAARGGRGCLVVVSGEPGIGKSRLADEAWHTIVGRGSLRILLQCSPQRMEAPFYPVISAIERALRLDTAQQRNGLAATRLRQLLAGVGMQGADEHRLLIRLLGLATDGADRDDLSPALLKQRTMEVLVGLVAGLSRGRPVFILLEDGHWIDPSSRELIGLLAECLPELRALALVTTRRGLEAPWLEAPACAHLPLTRLPTRQGAAMARRLLEGHAVPAEVIARIVRAGEGVPLFIEELSRAFLEASGGAGGLFQDGGARGAFGARDIPGTLSELLTARLDQLGDAREIACIGSAVGRSFPVELVRRVASSDAAAIEDALERLTDLGLASVRGRSRHRVCTFRHVLIQEAAYRSMLRDVRQAVHRRIAEIFEDEYRAMREASPEVLAHHYAEAGDVANAIRKFHEAGQLAAARSANVEAARLMDRALELVRSQAAGADRDQLELSLLVSQGPVLITLKGPGAPEAQATYTRAIGLCGLCEQAPSHFPAYWGWWRTSPDFKEMHARAQALSAYAASLKDEQLQLQAHHCQWATLFMLGEQRACCAHIEEGLRLYGRGDYRTHGTLYGGHDPKGCALGEKALSLWLQGHASTSLQACEENLAHVAALRHVGSMAHAWDQEIMLRRYRGEAGIVLVRARAMRAFGREQRLPDLVAKADIFEGWAMAMLGDAPAGVGRIEGGLETQRRIGTQEDFPVYFEMLAEAHGLAGRPELALSMVEEAMAMADRTDLRYWTAEIYRRRGELALLGEGAPAACAWFDRAILLARSQGAHALELRASLAKARVLVSSGRRPDALACLDPIARFLAEDPGAGELAAARRLLEELR
jgi:predicted ATPase/class 3 adenylate cyclase